MNITAWYPLREKDISKRINKFLGEGFMPSRMFSEMKPFSESGWRPLVDILEDKKQIVLKVDVPEISSEDIDIKVDGRILTISGERKFEEKTEKRDYHCIERNYGSFFRSFKLPEAADAENIKAHYNKGVLRIEIKKRKTETGKKIKINVEK